MRGEGRQLCTGTECAQGPWCGNEMTKQHEKQISLFHTWALYETPRETGPMRSSCP